MATRNLLERANLRLEGYFRALYIPLGGSKTQMENAPSMEVYISMFSDKPLYMPLCFGTVIIILPEPVGAFSSFFFLFFSLCSSSFFLFLNLYGKGFFFSFFFLLSLLLPLPLLS